MCAAVSCEALNIEQAEQDVKGQCVGASLSSGSPPHTSPYSIMDGTPGRASKILCSSAHEYDFGIFIAYMSAVLA